MARLRSHSVIKPWGVDRPPPPFSPSADGPVGEIWFTSPPPLADLLAKYIFTSEKLSVQVHPSDTQTIAKGLGRQGKEECWLVLAAEPDARLAIGFTDPVDAETIHAAALDGSIEQLLAWHPVTPGSFFYIPAGTVHAIGAGITLIEVQQNSDITYRLFDYGRPRELHLEDGLAVANGGIYPADLARLVPPTGEVGLVDGPYFRLDRLSGPPSAELRSRYAGPLMILPIDKPVTLDGEAILPGECGMADSIGDIIMDDDGICLIAQGYASNGDTAG